MFSRFRTFVLFAASAILTQWAPAQVITGFGSLEQNPFNVSTDFIVPWTGSQTTTTVSVSNVSNGGGGILQDISGSPVTLFGGFQSIYLQGSLISTAPATNHFDIVLYDANENTMTASFDWSSFTGGALVSSVAVVDPSFDGTVTKWGLTTFGAPSETVSFTFDTLAVPEPAAVTMFASAGFMLLAWRVRSTKRRS